MNQQQTKLWGDFKRQVYQMTECRDDWLAYQGINNEDFQFCVGQTIGSHVVRTHKTTRDDLVMKASRLCISGCVTCKKVEEVLELNDVDIKEALGKVHGAFKGIELWRHKVVAHNIWQEMKKEITLGRSELSKLVQNIIDFATIVGQKVGDYTVFGEMIRIPGGDIRDIIRACKRADEYEKITIHVLKGGSVKASHPSESPKLIAV